MRSVLFFSAVSCFIIGILGAVGAGAILNNGNEDLQGIGVLLSTFIFIGMGARFAYRLGTEKRHRIFFPKRHWWQ